MLYKSAIFTLSLILFSAASVYLLACGGARAARSWGRCATTPNGQAGVTGSRSNLFVAPGLFLSVEKGGSAEQSSQSNFSSRRI